MKWLGVVIVLVASCTKPNPRSCLDGLCSDPQFPFCDVDGALAGEPQQCVAVSCTADEFEACRGDQEVRCNSTGNNYELVECELGCSSTGGCRLCEPNQTRCTNGKVATCDGNGAIVASEVCDLGCFEDRPRCRRINPSNGLADYLDLQEHLLDFDLTNAIFDTGTGAVTSNGQIKAMPSFTAPNGDGPTIRVFVANNVRIDGGQALNSTTPNAYSGAAFALVTRGTITIEGRFIAGGKVGGVANSTCAGGVGNYFETDSSSRAVASGGGGNATAGGSGGNISSFAGGAGGQAFGTDHLEPLKGGCPSGGVDLNNGTVTLYSDVAGGGAVQFTSEKSIKVLGIIDVRGKQGEAEQVGFQGAAVYGGGAGGSILLEAPQVKLGPTAILMAKGGGGGSYGPSLVSDDTIAPDRGNICAGTCPDGGDGAAPGFAAEAGEPSPAASGSTLLSGGGGGGMGRVRINTQDATYERPNTVIEAAMVTSGLIKTR